jgi:hypothetical protein
MRTFGCGSRIPSVNRNALPRGVASFCRNLVHRLETLLVDGHRDVGADAGQRDRLVAHGDRLGRDHEEPCARHRHHHVPYEARHREWHIKAPETLPRRKVKRLGSFFQIAWNRDQRLIEAERHVPRLAGEDGEYACQFRAQHLAGKQRHEENHGEGDVAENRHRLQDVENRNEHQPGAPALGGKRCIGKGEHQGGHQRGQHAQRRSQGVFGQVERIERNRRLLHDLQGGLHLADADKRQRQAPENERRRHQIPPVRQIGPNRTADGKVAVVSHCHRLLRARLPHEAKPDGTKLERDKAREGQAAEARPPSYAFFTCKQVRSSDTGFVTPA